MSRLWLHGDKTIVVPFFQGNVIVFRIPDKFIRDEKDLLFLREEFMPSSYYPRKNEKFINQGCITVFSFRQEKIPQRRKGGPSGCAMADKMIFCQNSWQESEDRWVPMWVILHPKPKKWNAYWLHVSFRWENATSEEVAKQIEINKEHGTDSVKEIETIGNVESDLSLFVDDYDIPIPPVNVNKKIKREKKEVKKKKTEKGSKKDPVITIRKQQCDYILNSGRNCKRFVSSPQILFSLCWQHVKLFGRKEKKKESSK